jgi:Na+/proline symporter
MLAVLLSMIAYGLYYSDNNKIWGYVSYTTFLVNLIECLSMLCMAYIFW